MLPQAKDRGVRIEAAAAQIFIVPKETEALVSASDEESSGEDLSDNQHEIKAQIFRCQELIQQGARPESICILARKNADLLKFSWAHMYRP